MTSLRSDELPPCFVDSNGDIIISIPYMVCAFDFGTLEMRISSDKLIAVSSYFATTLKPEWLHNKVTGTENCSDGITRVMKRFELELDQDGKDILVGKVVAASGPMYHNSRLMPLCRQLQVIPNFESSQL